MQSVFLTASWEKLIMANFEVPDKILESYLPPGTELDKFQGKSYVSIVGFLFINTRILGIPAFFHSQFEELNLRFYVRYKEGNRFKRGTVFISEIVPKPLITLIAKTFYNEPYSYKKMNHSYAENDEKQEVRYEWKSRSGWNFIEVEAKTQGGAPHSDSHEAFITEHYWGYNSRGKNALTEYAVEHNPWKVFPVNSFNFVIHTKDLYGMEFEPYLINPFSVFLVKGSDVLVRTPNKITIQV